MKRNLRALSVILISLGVSWLFAPVAIRDELGKRFSSPISANKGTSKDAEAEPSAVNINKRIESEVAYDAALRARPKYRAELLTAYNKEVEHYLSGSLISSRRAEAAVNAVQVLRTTLYKAGFDDGNIFDITKQLGKLYYNQALIQQRLGNERKAALLRLSIAHLEAPKSNEG